MTRYLLDTSALIDFSKGRDPARSAILGWIDAGDTLAVCSIVVAEFYSGLDAGEASQWEVFIASLTYWHISPPAAIRAGQERYRYARQGKALAIADALIAATALQHDALLATGNVKDYPMSGLALFPLLPDRI